MLSRKAALVLVAAVTLLTASVLLQRFSAAIGAAALLLLLSVGSIYAVPPAVSARVEVRSERASEGQSVRSELSLTNGSRNAVVLEHRLELPPVFRRESEAAGRVVVGAGDERHWEVVVKPSLFGVFDVGPLTVRASDPSGLHFHTYEAAPARPLLVHPRTQRLKTTPLRLGEKVSFFGVNEARQPGDGFEFYTLRSWQHGDSMRSINWRASARSDGLVVNQRQRESYLLAALVLDATASSGQGRLIDSPFAVCGRAMASLAEFLLHNRDQVTMWLMTDRLAPIHSQTPERQRMAILETLATTRPHGAERWETVVERLLPKLSPGQPVVLASSFETDPTVVPAVRELAAREHQVVLLSAPTAWPEHREEEPWVEARRLHRAMVRDEGRAAGALFVELSPGKPLSEALLEAMLA